jgi:amino acid adenylation domain-containing protein
MAVYGADLFDRATVERLTGCFATLLRAAVSEPERRLSDLPLLGAAELHQLVTGWNDTAVGPPASVLVPGLVAGQTRRAPGALAVRGAGRELSYGDLDRLSARVAAALRRRGVAPESRVAVLAERSPETVAALLGVLRAGAAYLPLDPGHPDVRLAWMVADAEASVVLVEESLRGRAAAVAGGAAVVVVGEEEQGLQGGEEEWVGVEPEGLAYVVYTSGSTGLPKGVAVSHGALLNLVAWHRRAYGLAPADRSTHLAAPGFDAAVWEVWPVLAAGASLHQPPEEIRSSPAGLSRWLEAERVTVSFLPTPLAQALLAEPELPRGLRLLLTGGDRLQRVPDRPLPFQLINHYGPTEAAVVSTAEPVAPGTAAPPIGRPIDNLRAYVLDRGLRPAPAGVPGELWVGGTGVARGYLGRPELTAERFLPDPFGAPGARLYRTGDLVRRLADGRLDFLGRVDDQIKLRGFRIEPAEIEAALLQHPAVAAAVAVVREDTPGDRRLVAYVVPAGADEAGDPAAQVERWSTVFDQHVYQDADLADGDPTFNIAGWQSTATGASLGAPAMRAWLADRIERIRERAPRRILEIGCGTGMLLFRLAPGAERYVGTDVSRASLDYVERLLAGRPMQHVELLQRPADDVSGFAPGGFDAVILNSVVQYFPSIDYLLDVLEKAFAALAPGGFVFLGDLRSLPLLEAFHRAAEQERDPEADPAVLAGRARLGRLRENELAVDPELFAALRARLPRLGPVEVHLQRGRHRNELSRFRYDVLLHAAPAPAAPGIAWLDWEADVLDLDRLRRRLADGPERLGVRRIPNARVAEPGIEPQDLLDLAEGLGYRAATGWSGSTPDGRFDAVLVRPGAAEGAPAALLPIAQGGSRRAWTEYANDPLWGKQSHALGAALRRHLDDRLPEHMVPAAFVPLDRLPLSTSGKVDRRALPAPGAAEQGATAPRTPLEAWLAALWAEVLGVERVAIEDDFFALGGHSLLATQVVSRLRDALGVELPLRALFEHPTVAGLAAAVEPSLAPVAAAPPVAPVPRDGRPLPLSFAQRRLWFLDRLAPGNPFYNIPAVLRLAGPLDREALRRALSAVLRRHEVLRSRFAPGATAADEPAQVPLAPAELELPLADLGALPAAAQAAEARRLGVAEGRRPFVLERGPLVRATLLRLSGREHLLVLAFHHIAFDGWSLGVFSRDLDALYDAFLDGRPAVLPELPVQYADFAAWQRSWLTGAVLTAQLDHWRARLAGVQPLALPTDRPRPAVQSFQGAALGFSLPLELTRGLETLARRGGATLFTTLLAAFQALLHRRTGQDDVVLGAPVANRNRREIEDLIGFFVNSLVLRADCGGDPAFRDLLAQTRERALEAQAHQDLPFERLVEELHPERDLGRNPLFQIAFALQNAPGSPVRLRGLEVEAVEVEIRTTRFDLEVHLWSEPRGLQGLVYYDTDLFDGTTVRRLADHFQALLAGAAADPAARLSELPLLGAAERHQVATEWNDTAADYPREATIHALFARATHRFPDLVAVEYGERTLTYAELDSRSDALARALVRLGAGPEVPVAVLAERGPELIVALLAILRAGGAYLPLDPAWPPARLAWMLDDAGAAVLLAGDSFGATVRALPPHRAVVLGLETALAAAGTAGPPGPPIGERASADHLAYLIYTSGSTGRPKGVAVPHRAVLRLVLGTDYVRLGPGDRIAQASTAAFDAATFEIWGALLQGARVVGVPREVLLSAPELEAEIRRRCIQTLFLTTALFHQLARERPALFAPLRELLFGGETADPAAVRRVLAAGPPRRLLHVYGPTESTTFATWHPVAEPPGAAAPPIGRPIANTSLRVLDPGLRPVPPGGSGELCLGGDGLARGYLGRPDLTAERFIPDPLGEPGARLYRTGDLARLRPDGTVEHLGRLDHQVKLRGFRIELGEVEATLLQQPSVAEAVAVVREDSPGDRRLTAYVVPAGAGEDGGGQVERWSAVFDEHVYREVDLADGDPTFNIAGWKSSYTGASLGAAAMRTWLDDRIERIRSLHPRRILEIGCGTGMLLFRLAPGCERYAGTDVSRASLAYVERLCGLPQVELWHRPADDFTEFAPGSFDAVLLNSVVQYFPSLDYLLAVLEKAFTALAPGGFVFLGDLRSLPLLEAFHATLELHRAEPGADREEMRGRVRSALRRENELAVDPALFAALRGRLPGLGPVEIHLQRGRHDNELTRFRYDVVLHAGSSPEAAAVSWLDWEGEGLDLARLRQRLERERPDALVLVRVPNARLGPAVRALRWLDGEPAPETEGVHPDDVAALAAELGYRCATGWSDSGREGRFDAVLARDGAAAVGLPLAAGDGAPRRPWASYANQPLRSRQERSLPAELQAALAERLPEFMIPADVVVLDRLPLNAAGKIERSALPPPDGGRTAPEESFVAPRTADEEALAALWAEVLGRDRVGAHDDFFRLGGHSLLATQLASRIRETFHVEVPLRSLFETPTVAGYAQYLDVLRWATGSDSGAPEAKEVFEL